MGYLAFVLGPATAGAVATMASLQVVISGIAIAGAVVALLATRLQGMQLKAWEDAPGAVDIAVATASPA